MFSYSLSKYVFRFRRACVMASRDRKAANKQTRLLIADIRFQQRLDRLRAIANDEMVLV